MCKAELRYLLQGGMDFRRHLRMRVQVFGGTVNCGAGALVVETTVDAAGSTVARMAALVEQVHPPTVPCKSCSISCLHCRVSVRLVRAACSSCTVSGHLSHEAVFRTQS